MRGSLHGVALFLPDQLSLTEPNLWTCGRCLEDLKQYTHSNLYPAYEKTCAATNAYNELFRSGRAEALLVHCCTGADMMPLP